MEHTFPPLTGTSTHVSLTHYRCLDTTSMTTTCTTYDSGVLVLDFNGHQVLLYLSSSAGKNVTYINITRGVICTAYKVWVDEANGTIMSEITCTGLGGLSEPLHISCMSDSDKAGVCTAELGNTSCATPTSIPSSKFVLCVFHTCTCVFTPCLLILCSSDLTP